MPIKITATTALSLRRIGGQFVTITDLAALGTRSLVLERGAVLYALPIGIRRQYFLIR